MFGPDPWWGLEDSARVHTPLVHAGVQDSLVSDTRAIPGGGPSETRFELRT